jgi:hypothetical protein
MADLSLRSLASVLLDRFQWMRQAGLGFGGARDYYNVLGYDRVITTKQYRDEYARGGIAKRIVEAFPKATWRGGVELYEDEKPDNFTPFEIAWRDHLEKRLNVWATFLKADILAGLSTYSVILIGDGQNVSEELTKGSPEKLVYLQPYCGSGGPPGTNNTVTSALDSSVTITKWDTDINSPRFGEPLMYQLRRALIGVPSIPPIHWSRIIHVAEGCLEDSVFGVPTLENVWNLLQDLMKVTGGGAEAFWLRANQGLNLNLDKDVTMAADDAAKLKDEVDDYRHNISRVLKTRGMNVNTLGSDVANFSNPAEAILTQIAGSKGIPMRILTGSERGELASTQDAANFNTQVQDRRTNYAGPLMVRRLVDRLIEYGYLPTPKQYDVFWPTVQTMSDKEKAEGAQLWAKTNQSMGETVYTNEEIRSHWHDMEPLAPADVKPIAGPVRVSDQTTDPKALAASEDDEMLRVLEMAIVTGNAEVVNRIVGLEVPKGYAPAPTIVAGGLRGNIKILRDKDNRIAEIIDEGAKAPTRHLKMVRNADGVATDIIREERQA